MPCGSFGACPTIELETGQVHQLACSIMLIALSAQVDFEDQYCHDLKFGHFQARRREAAEGKLIVARC
jgi:hypothetical protein